MTLTHPDLTYHNLAVVAEQLLAASVDRLHSFLPTQLGDLLWALGSLNFTLTNLGGPRADRTVRSLSHCIP